jgi:acetyl-CoA carboxylase biotin carboxylase subunit
VIETPPFSKILISNRGEIAVRIIRACREMGIRSVAVYSDADAEALHVQLADEAQHIGAPEPSQSYLNATRIIQAALQAGAEAIHPGYGFLAENPDFCQAVLDAGITFIGPPPGAIRAMGDKAEARELMSAAGVPTVPGFQGSDADVDLLQAAGSIGFPALVKAAAGGGGKGMRIARHAAELPEALAAARREAAHAFGDPRLILEKYVENARHIEIQVLADEHGNTLHLNERECSIQRRHQKIIEEAPSPLLDADLRSRMGAAAVAAAEAVGYTSAGTVEFIVDPQTRAFYFLEMNTRLQVEHPVTELVTGLDLVQWQIRIAAGEALPLSQDDVVPRGHAIECRLYAEDPANGFLPAIGPVLHFQPPEGPGIRVDTGITSGGTVSTYYDPMIAKLIVQADTRQAAIRRMQSALESTILLGVTTNLEFLQTVLAHPVFRQGAATTAFIDRHLSNWKPQDELPLAALIAAAFAGSQAAPLSTGNTPVQGHPSPWVRLKGFRLGEDR